MFYLNQFAQNATDPESKGNRLFRGHARHTWGYIGGAAITVGGSLLKPKAKAGALAAPIDLTAQQGQAVQGNLANTNSIDQLVGQTNSFNQSQASSLMEQAMPGYTKLASQFTNTASNDLAHPYDVPADVTANIQRLASENGIRGGTGGNFNNFSLLRDFGVNELNYGQAKIGQAQSITSMLSSIAPKVNPLSPLSMYVTPGQEAQVAAGNNSALQASNNAQAAATNYNDANLWGTLSTAAGGAVGAYLNRPSTPPKTAPVNTGNLVQPLSVQASY